MRYGTRRGPYLTSQLLRGQCSRKPISLKHAKSQERRDRSLDEELTELKPDVLRILVGELSTRHKSQTLYVVPSTVRTMVESVYYQTLGVSSREEAV